MSAKPVKKRKTDTTRKIDEDMAIPPGEHLVPIKTGLNSDETWIKKLIKKIR